MAAGSENKHGSAWTRPIRRVFRPFLSRAERARVAQAIAEAEKRSTGQIHVHLVGKAPPDILAAAPRFFQGLGLTRTKRRNGVLILVSHLDHRFAIWGDQGIHDAAGQALWDRAGHILKEEFRKRRYCEGLEKCIAAIGDELAKRFPPEPGNRNELLDDVTDS